jgi:hypothetical protein
MEMKQAQKMSVDETKNFLYTSPSCVYHVTGCDRQLNSSKGGERVYEAYEVK